MKMVDKLTNGHMLNLSLEVGTIVWLFMGVKLNYLTLMQAAISHSKYQMQIIMAASIGKENLVVSLLITILQMQSTDIIQLF